MSAIIYDFKPIGGTLRKHRLDDWWNPAKPEPEAERLARQDAVMRKRLPRSRSRKCMIRLRGMRLYQRLG
jgi:hypothetical protein